MKDMILTSRCSCWLALATKITSSLVLHKHTNHTHTHTHTQHTLKTHTTHTLKTHTHTHSKHTHLQEEYN